MVRVLDLKSGDPKFKPRPDQVVPGSTPWLHLYMLWFKFILGLKFFELVSILFSIVPDYGNEYTTKENKT